MKRILLFILLHISSTIAIAQTTWTGLGANTNWNNTDNWDTNMVPTVSDDVIIPTGFTVTLNIAGTVKSIDVQGNSTFEMSNSLNFTDPSTFGVNTIINWNSGTLNGGTSTLTHQGVLHMLTGSSKNISGGMTLQNEGTMTIASNGDLRITENSILNNTSSGIIDMQADSGNITWSGISGTLNNLGLIKKTTSTGEAQIIIPFTNNNGTIQVESGELSIQNAASKRFINGTYNVFSGAIFTWDTQITIEGTLSGDIDGTLNWNDNLNVAVGTTATFNFSTDNDFNWADGNLLGGGTVVNNNILNLTTGATKVVSGDSTFENNGTINIASVGDLRIIGVNSSINNKALGIIDMQEDSGNITWSGTAGLLFNDGLIKKTTSTGEAQIITPFTNNNGTIQVESGILSIQNPTSNTFFGGTYNVFTNAVFDLDTEITIEGTLQGVINGTLNWNSTLVVANGATATFDFSVDTSFNWNSGSLTGGGTLINNNTIDLDTGSTKAVRGGSTFNNNGKLNFVSAGDLWIADENSLMNNNLSGVIDLQTASGNITWSGTAGLLVNQGLISRTTNTGEAQILIPFTNNDGTIQVEEGTLSIQISEGKTFLNGTYNVFADAIFDLDTEITIEGTLQGVIDGALNWNNVLNVVDMTSASLDFTVNNNFNWTNGSLTGGGTAINNSVISLTTGGTKNITGATTFENNGTINFESNGDLWITSANTVLNNNETGFIDMKFDSGNISWSGTSGTLNNFGLLSRSTSTGLAQIFTDLNNFGTIEIASGELEITSSRPFTNTTTGVIRGIGIFDLPPTANYTNNGSFAPGLSPGTLNVQGDYTSASTSQLEIELNGLTPDTEYDVLAITGNNNVFEGSVAIIMGFEGNIGDEFTIATTSGTIASGNLQSPIENIDFDGKRYTFEVSYPDTNKVVLTITDKLDILPPDIITQNITVQLDESGSASILPSEVDNGTTDNCTPNNELLFELDIDTFTCGDLGDNTVNLTVTDNDGNFATVSATVTVEDVLNPTVVTQDLTLQLDASGNASILASEVDNGSSDNCTVANLSLDVSDFTCADLGTNTVTLTVTDQSGNSASETATITVEDTTNPTVIAQNLTVQLNASGNASILASEVDNGSSDNCTVANLSLDTSDFTCADLGTNTVTLTVTDQSGNSASETAIITVEDTTNPTVIAQNLTVQLNASGSASILASEVDNGSSDNCTIANLSLDTSDFTCADLGTNTVTLTVTDQSGNSASETATITVEDVINPAVIAQNLTVQLDASGNASILASEVDNGSSDNCTVANLSLDTSDFTCADLGTNTVTLTITDQSGNSASETATITVEDTTNPTVIAQNLTVQLDASGNASILASEVDNGSSDNCTVANLSLDTSDFTCADLGTNTVTLTVTDQSGNSASETATITVEDTTNPTVIAQNLTVQLNASGSASILASEVDNGSSDNCTVANLSLDTSNFTCADLGTNTVTLTVTDQSGNSASETATITVEDTTNPTVIAQNLTVQLDASGNASILASEVDNGSSDNCTVANLSLDTSDFTCADLGTNTVTLTVTDQSGNSASETAIITVEDTTNPTVITQDITVSLDTSGAVSITAGDIDNGSTDNCSISSLSLDVTDFSCSDLGVNTVNLTVTDQSSNTASATANVIIIDEISPVIDCPDGLNVESTGDFILPDYIIDGLVTVSDNCGFSTLQTPAPGTNLSQGDHIIEFEITDYAGNTASCSFNLKVNDMTLNIGNNELLDAAISLYPNPVKDVFTINNPKKFNLLKATIIDVKGSIIQKNDLRSMGSKATISMQGYPSGIYFVKIESENSFTTKRVIKM
ncbi:HYR domain-containing protein [Winogradskyella sp.]|uniref:HYR domain-containing protein n=1 Tax=Winogradskyella sp. TaxID=1883156 RepID=UPI003BA94C81